MVRQAKANLKGIDNIRLLVGDGATLSGIDDHSHDFAFSFIVFQHVPSYDVVASYCREVHRVLRPGSLFKLQVQGVNWAREEAPDTWQGVSFSQEDAFRLCKETGFVFERSAGAGSQYFWLWFRKPLTAASPAEAKSDQAPEGAVPATNRYFEDLKIGDRFETASAPMSEEAIMDFARQWDPQPMHLNHAAAAQSPYKGIIASGWHTAAMVMKLTAEAKPMGDVEVLGLGVTEMQWPQPVRPGDTVRVEMEVTGVRPSKSQPGYGIVSVTSTAYNQRGEVVFVVRPNLWVPRRPG
jgi:acyl dehydratase